ncbi:MAG TPA: IS200/IS605 family transposase [Gemmatimonadales bacterium]|nr:IS200/IS605 family transposase [Gemmatimonadales bacterium]
MRGTVVKQGRRHAATGLYAHITWHTWRRQFAVYEPDVPVIIAAIRAAAERTGFRIAAVAVLAEHVHVVVSYLPTSTVSNFIREAKSESARRVRLARPESRLRWGRGYYAGSLSWSHLRAARCYVARQRIRHPDRIPVRVFDFPGGCPSSE